MEKCVAEIEFTFLGMNIIHTTFSRVAIQTIRKNTRTAEGFKAVGPLFYELDMRPNGRNTHSTLKVFDVSIKVQLLEIH